MQISDEDVALHESGHWVIGAVNGFPMGAILMIATVDGGFSGRTGYKEAFSDLTTNEARRAAIRTCLAGEAARGVRSLDDFTDEAKSDVELATAIAGGVDSDENVEEILAAEFERTVEEVEAQSVQLKAVASTLLKTCSPGGHRSLGGIAAAKAMGWRPVRDGHAILRFEPDPCPPMA